MADAKTTTQLMKQFQKTYGANVGAKGYQPAQIERCPTGVFQFDLGIGGGFPRNKETILYGPESSGKSLQAYLAIAYQQLTQPHLQPALFDVEGTYDPKWVRKLGIDPDRLIVIRPDYAEQAVDMIEVLLKAPDCGLVVVDSVAAFLTTKELNQSAEKEPVGALALAMSKLVGKAVGSMIEAEKNGYWGTLVLINQTRTKIGVMYGDPETYPGGNKQRFASSLSIRLYGKNLTAKGQSKPYAKHHSAIIKKWKVPVLTTHIEWDTHMITYDGRGPGYTGGWHDAEKILRSTGLLTQDSKLGWCYDNACFKTLKEWEAAFDENPTLRVSIVNRILAQADLELETAGDDEDFEVDDETGEVTKKVEA